MIYFIWYAGWVSIIDSIVFVYLTLALKLNTKRYNTYTAGARKHGTLRNKVKQKQFFYSFIIFFFYNYTYNVERAYI